MNQNILLTEANYKDKYPPLGLMKIATFHKLLEDNVEYSRSYKSESSDFYSKIYISTRFSFHWSKTKDLINFYQKNYDSEILIGGIHASINPDLYEKEFGIKPHIGSLYGDIKSILSKIQNDEILFSFLNDIEKYGIDVLPPDYSIFFNQELPFNKILKDNYFLRATKGCKRDCSFCDVKKICEGYIEKLPILPIIKYIDTNFGSKANILFFDDNTLMSNKLDDIVSDLKKAGFTKGAKVNRKLRLCDFNQGLDLRLLTTKKIDLLNSLCINPVRFAFDDISTKNIFIDKINKVIESGIKNISVYVLYNYKDAPEDFYERLRISAELNQKHGVRIFSFPMKYIPNDQVNRKFIGKHWTKRMIRGVQCILNSSHGIVPVNIDFFNRAFGINYNEFYQIINMPEKYIIYRTEYNNQIEKWKIEYESLNQNNKNKFLEIISNEIIDSNYLKSFRYREIMLITEHYIHEKF